MYWTGNLHHHCGTYLGAWGDKTLLLYMYGMWKIVDISVGWWVEGFCHTKFMSGQEGHRQRVRDLIYSRI